MSKGPKQLPQTVRLANNSGGSPQTTTSLDGTLENSSTASEGSQSGQPVTPQLGSNPVSIAALPGESTQTRGKPLHQDQPDHKDRCDPESGQRSHSVPVGKPPRYTHDISGERTGARTGETSCEEAANIIASLRGNGPDEDVWSELGCSSKQSCRVKTISVFELMDKE